MTGLEERLAEFVLTNSENMLDDLGGIYIYDGPVMGVARADDSLYFRLKDEGVIGPHHMTPAEWLPGAQSVISYFLPFSRAVRQANRVDDRWPATEWLYGRIEGEALNNAVRAKLVEWLSAQGGRALAPPLDERFRVVDLRSNWSERHTAFIAGLGTFNLSKSLITVRGCAGRFGSVVTDLELPATFRPYQDVYEYCNNCGACIERCPAKAIDVHGKDHIPCAEFVREVVGVKFAPRYGCGKCQTGVPCEDRIPD